MRELLSPRMYLAMGIGAAVALVAAGLVLMFVMVADTGQWRKLETGVGDRERTRLSDGTRVELNTDTVLRVRLREDSRELKLVRGEARFDVTHDPKRPLIVRARETVVRVVGTTFSVRIYENGEVTVLVEKGLVLVDHAPEPLIPEVFVPSWGAAPRGARVHPGSLATMNHGEIGVHAISDKELKARIAWRWGELIFEDQAFEEVLREFARYSGHDVKLMNRELAQRKFTGAFATHDIDKFLKKAEALAPMRIERDGETIEIHAEPQASSSGRR